MLAQLVFQRGLGLHVVDGGASALTQVLCRGHDIIAASAGGASFVLADLVSTVDGMVELIGMPAAEGGGGKRRRVTAAEALGAQHPEERIP